MNAKERAEKIFQTIDSGNFDPSTLVQDIAAELEAYVEEQLEAERNLRADWGYRIECLEKQLDEEKREAGLRCLAHTEKAKAEGRRAGLEEVLRIGDDNMPEFNDIHPQLKWFLGKIRALITTEANEGKL